MTHATLIAFSALTGMLTLTASAPNDIQLLQQDQADRALSKRATAHYEMEVEESVLDIGGEVMEPVLGSERITDYEVSVVERFGDVSDGWANKLQREYVSVVRQSGAEGIGSAEETGAEVRLTGLGEHESPWHEALVDFRWDADEEAYVAEIAEDSPSDAEDPSSLAARFDARGWLPEDDVEVGDSWEIPAEQMRLLFEPFGDLRWYPSELEESDDLREGMVAISIPSVRPGFDLPELDGDCRAVLREVEDGLARLDLEVALTFSGDIYDLRAEVQRLSVDTLDREFSLEGSGELVWNLAESRFESLELEAEVDDYFEGEGSLDFGMGEPVPLLASQRSVGSAVFQWECEPLR